MLVLRKNNRATQIALGCPVIEHHQLIHQSMRAGTTDSVHIGRMVREDGESEGGTHDFPIAVKHATLHHICRPGGWHGGVVRPDVWIIGVVIVKCGPISHPFKHVACHIHHSIWTSALGIAANLGGVASKIVIVQQCTGRIHISPQVHARIAATPGGFLPLSLGRQALAHPGAVIVGIVPRDVDHQVIGVSGVLVIGKAVGRLG